MSDRIYGGIKNTAYTSMATVYEREKFYTKKAGTWIHSPYHHAGWSVECIEVCREVPVLSTKCFGRPIRTNGEPEKIIKSAAIDSNKYVIAEAKDRIQTLKKLIDYLQSENERLESDQLPLL